MFRTLVMVILLAATPLVGAQEEQKPADPMHPQITMTTTMGDIVLELDAVKAPITVDNFLRYAKDGYYDGTIFHRVMSTFMIQGGGFTVEMEKKGAGLRKPIKNEWRNGLKNKRGAIAMARTKVPDSATSQFFINVVDNGSLDQARDGAAYCVFGKVVEGMDVVDKIKDTEVISHPKLPMGKVVPVEPIEIKSVTMREGWTFEAVFKATGEARKARIKAEQEARAKESEKELKLSKVFAELLEKKQDENGNKLQTTESGLMYVVIKEGEGAKPQSTDKVQVHYTGWLLNGTKFDSSVDRGRPATFPLNRVIAGWTEGVGLMKTGAKWRFVIPSDLGYGDHGSPPKIPAKATLVFDVELLGIK